MACQIQTDKYTDVVLDLIKLDPTLYNNFDNAATFILKSGLTPEQKMNAVHNIAHIYTGLSDLDPAYFVKGKVEQVITTISAVDSPEDYVKTVSEYYDIRKPSSLKVETILSKIDKLSSKTSINRLDLKGQDGILDMIKNYFAITRFESAEEQQKLLNELTTALRTAIVEHTDSQEYKDFLLSVVSAELDGLSKTSDFIPLSEIADMANLKNFLVTLNSGQMVETIFEEGNHYIVKSDGTLDLVLESSIASAKEARMTDRFKGNAGEFVFTPESLTSNFNIKGVIADQTDSIVQKLDQMPFPMSAVRISAVKISPVADNRLNRIKQVAQNNPSMSALERRNHETFETQAQVKYLQSTSKGKIVTLSRPSASNQVFVLVGEIIGTGEKFYMYANENLAFVNSDNSTESVDLTNEGHLAEIQKLSVKSTPEGRVSMSAEDLKTLQIGVRNYNNFKDSVLPAIQAEFDKGVTSVDVTAQFKNHFDMSQSKSRLKTKTLLSEEIETNPTFSKEVVVVNKTTGTREARKVPFVYNRTSGNTSVFELVDMLNSDEFIESTTDDGNVVERTHEAYAKEELGLKDKTVSSILASSDENQKNLMIRFREDGSLGYVVVENTRQLDELEEFATFIIGLSEILEKNKDINSLETRKNRDNAIFDFDMSQFAFPLTVTKREDGRNDRPLKIQFRTSKEGKLQIRLFPFDKQGRYGFMMIEGKNSVSDQFNFEINEKLIVDIAKSLRGEGVLVPKIKEKFPALAKFDLTKTDELFAFYRALNNMTRETSVDPLVQQLVEQIELAHEKLAASVVKDVVGRFEEKTNMFPQFMKNLKEDFTYNGEFKPEFLLVTPNDKGKNLLKVRYSPRYKAKEGTVNAKKRFGTDYKNYKVVSSNKSHVAVVPKAATLPSIESTTEVITPAAPVEKQHVVESVAPAIIVDTDNIEEIPLSAVGQTEEIVTETAKERENASTWLLENLPQFSIDSKDIPEILDLARIDATVLGAFKNRVIYLNNNILSKGVVYHEAFHGVFRYLMTSQERQQIVDQVRNNAKYSARFTESALREFATVRNLVYSKERMEALQAEEILAEGFQQYMIKKGPAPKGIIGKIAELIRKLIELFKNNGDYIDRTYERIRKGGYKNASVATSGLFQDEVAFEIPGLKKIVPKENGVGVGIRLSTISSDDQDQLVNMMTYMLLTDNVKGESYEKKFDRLAKDVLDYVYNIDVLIAKNPAKKDAIVKKFGELYSQYRFILGARMLGEKLTDINLTGRPEYDGRVRENLVSKSGQVLNNTDGNVSKKMLMDLVLQNYNRTNAILEGVSLEEKEITPKAVDQSFTEEGSPVVNENNPDGVNDDETDNSNNFDENIFSHNRLESMSKEIRNALALTYYDKEDKELGIKYPRMINGEKMYSFLLQLSANIDSENIMSHIKSSVDSLRYDGYQEDADDLEAVYKNLANRTGIVENGKPVKNPRLYNMLIDALEGTETELLMTNVDSVESTISDPEGGDVKEFNTVGYTMRDQIFSKDIDNVKKSVVASIITTHAEKSEDKEYIASVKNLVALSKEMSKTFILSSVNQGKRLNDLTEEIHKALEVVGITLPKSLVRLSILAIDRVENKAIIKESDFEQSVLDHYNAHNNLIGEGKYLEKDFFTDIAAIFSLALSETHNKFASILDDKTTRNENVKRFNTILGKASTYTVKYNPSARQSTVINSEGKPIYRYVKYTPASIVAQSLRTKGLKATLESDPYFKSHLEAFIKDNPALGKLLEENAELSMKDRQVALLLKNFKVALYGGVTQKINGKFMEGATFKNIDSKSMYILNIISTLNRNVTTELVKDKEGKSVPVSVKTYMRSFSQLEASQTNFLITGLYEKYADKSGLITGANKRLKIVDTLEEVIHQEYNRVAREFERASEEKTKFDNGEKNNLVLKYSAVHKKGDPSQADVTNESLRAYKFNKLADFFKQNPDAYTSLREQISSKTKFEEIPAEVKNTLLDQLDVYAKQQLQKHIDELVRLGALTLTQEKDAKGNVVNIYESKLIPTTLRVNGVKTGDALDNYEYKNGRPSLEGLVADSFFNFFANSLKFNDILDGDVAMNVNDATDYFKRQKKFLAAGSTMKKGTHTVAYINTIQGYVNEKYPQYGPFYSVEEMNRYFTTHPDIDADVVKTIKDEYGVKGSMRDTFDGQSFSTLMHQIDMHEATGRLSPEIFDLLIAKHYRPLIEKEVKLMKDNKVVNNPKKTVTAARNSYHKLSESIIDRNDVSQIIMPESIRKIENDERRAQAYREYKKSLYDTFQNLYLEIYNLRQKIKDAAETGEDTLEFQAAIVKNYEQIHKYYEPLKNREKLHDILNAMEFHQVDQVVDTTASKNATLLPVDYFSEKKRITGTKQYINLPMSSIQVDNRFKFIQVETSGVKDVAKFSVQSKALIAADIANLAKIAEASGKELSKSDEKAIEDAANALTKYQITLKDIGESNLINLKTIIRKGGDFDIGKVFTLIRTSLLEQGAPESTLKLFEVDEAGKPLFSSNLPGIRNMLEFYFFSQYSKHITDEKGSGGKNIHISGFGYDVLEDTDGKIITTEEYQKDPSKYPNVTSRPLGVKTREVDGKTVHFVEAIVALPYFKSKKHREFYIKNLTKMFATRIPTEDKRSMVALEIVDFIDGSNLNGVIVPQMVHMLSGSDFDVDALYSQTYAHYFNASQTPSLYGDYSNYKNEQEGKFVEFVNYMSSDSDLSAEIALEKQKLKEDKNFFVTETAYNFLKMSGITDDDFENAVEISILHEDLVEKQTTRSEMKEESKKYKELKQKFVAAKQYLETNPGDKEMRKEKNRLGKELADTKTLRLDLINDIDDTTEEINDLRSKTGSGKNFIKQVLQAEATLRVFEKNNLPVNLANFTKNPSYAQSVRPVYQNKNLDAKLEIMSNDAVFKYLYINERSSVDRFKDILKNFGIALEDFDGLYNPYTIDGVVFTKKTTSMNKDGIGITANINKFLALASQFGVKIKEENLIWKFSKTSKDSKGNVVVEAPVPYDTYGGLNDENQRAIALIGNILGMFADGAKKPIPAALYMNEVNAGVTLGMVGLGLSPEFAFGFNFVPEIRSAVETVQANNYALNESTQNNDFVTLGGEVKNQLKDIIENNPEDYAGLKALGLFEGKSTPFATILNNKNLIINFKAEKLDSNTLKNNKLTTEDIGYSVFANGSTGPVKLTEVQQRMILLHMYAAQAQQMFDVQRAGSVVNMFKALNPRFVYFDKMMDSMKQMLNGESIFEIEGVNNIFSEDQVFSYLFESLEDLDKQSSNLFLERSPSFSAVKKLFESVFTDHSLIAKISTSFVGLRKYILTSENQDLKDVFTAEHWFTNTLNQELQEMQKKYPNNKFLQLLRVEGTDNFAYDAEGKMVKERALKMINKSKLSGDYAKEVNNDAQMLYYEENKFYKKLFYNELARTGLLPKAGSFMQMFDPDLQKDISKNIEDFVKVLKEKGDTPESVEKAMQQYLGVNTSAEDVHLFFNELFVQLANAATTEVGNKKIKSVRNIILSSKSNLVKSFNFPESVKVFEIQSRIKAVADYIAPGLFNSREKTLAPSATNKDKTSKQFLTLNLTIDAQQGVTEQVVNSFAKLFNVKNSTKQPNSFEFPFIIRVEGQSYMLQGVDETISKGGLGESIVRSIAKSSTYQNVGLVAQYALIPKELSAGTFSPIGFAKETSEKYMSLVNHKTRLDGTSVKTPIAKVETKTPVTPETQEQVSEDPADNVADQTDLIKMLSAGLKTETTETAPVEPVNSIQPGQFVKFAGNTFIATKVNPNGTMQIYNPTLEGAEAKKSVSVDNLTPVNGKAEIVSYKNASYMVTPKNTIISLTTNKAMNWGEENGDRKNIIALADKSRTVNTDIQNLNLTQDVLDTLYSQSSKRMSKAEFSKAAFDIVSNLRALKSNQEIIEKIKCL